MAYNAVNGKKFVWWHFSEFEESDFETLEEHFQFHPLDFDDIRDETELTKLDVYKHYLFSIINIPVFDLKTMQITKRNLGVFISKDYIVTVTRKPIESVDRFFERAQRSSGLRREAMAKSTGFFLYKLLDYIFRDTKVILRELVRETDQVEKQVYDSHTRVTTKRLGMLRRNVLFMRHMIEPQKILLEQFLHAKKTYLPNTLEIYFDDIRDSLKGISVMLDNHKNIVDGLFDVNEAFLSHRTNEIIRFLTIISVVLMPPTLITSYYGMNVDGLPFRENILLVSMIIGASLILFVLLILRIDKKK